MKNLSRQLLRLLELQPQESLFLSGSEGLKESLLALLAPLGVNISNSAKGAKYAVLEIDSLPLTFPTKESQAFLLALEAGTRLVILAKPPKESPDSAAQIYAPRMGLEKAHAETTTLENGELRLLLRGQKRAFPDAAQVKALKAIGGDMKATVLMGHEGLSEGFIASTREALLRHGLLKVKLAVGENDDKDELAQSLAFGAGGDLILRIGKIALLYERTVDLNPPQQKRRRH